jgi:hypothetical protein
MNCFYRGDNCRFWGKVVTIPKRSRSAFRNGTGATIPIHDPQGRPSKRFCARNSGATVGKGTGDHACEYMTGDMVVAPGEAGGKLSFIAPARLLPMPESRQLTIFRQAASRQRTQTKSAFS